MPSYYQYKRSIMETLPMIGFLRLPEVLKIFPVSKTTWWDGIKAGRYPVGVKLSPGCTAWRVEDIKRLIDESK